MNEHSADSPPPLSIDEGSNSDRLPSRSSSPVEIRNDLIPNEQNTASVDYDSQDAGMAEVSGTSLIRSPGSVSDCYKPDPPGSVDGTLKEVPRGTDTSTDSSATSHEDKPRMDYINVPSILPEELGELEEEDPDLSMTGEESHVARVLADMGARQETTDVDDMPPKEAKEDRVLDQSAISSERDGGNGDRWNEYGDILVPDVQVQRNGNGDASAPYVQVQDTTTNIPIVRVYNAPTEKPSPPFVPQPEESGEPYGPDSIPFLPRVDRGYPPTPTINRIPQQGYSQQPPFERQSSFRSAPEPAPMMTGGRRKMRLRLQEDIPTMPNQRTRSGSFLGHIRRRSSRMMFGSDQALPEMAAFDSTVTDRGIITVSWFEGTSSLELQEHVRTSILRKLKLDSNMKLDSNIELTDIRVIDQGVDPPEGEYLQKFAPHSGSATDHAHSNLSF
jgi:hypothetical protein